MKLSFDCDEELLSKIDEMKEVNSKEISDFRKVPYEFTRSDIIRWAIAYLYENFYTSF